MSRARGGGHARGCRLMLIFDWTTSEGFSLVRSQVGVDTCGGGGENAWKVISFLNCLHGFSETALPNQVISNSPFYFMFRSLFGHFILVHVLNTEPPLSKTFA